MRPSYHSAINTGSNERPPTAPLIVPITTGFRSAPMDSLRRSSALAPRGESTNFPIPIGFTSRPPGSQKRLKIRVSGVRLPLWPCLAIPVTS
jgi:hypothetical protein